MPVRTNGPSPYGPPRGVLLIINKYRDHGLIAPFTADVLLRAGISESLVGRTLSTLQQLDLTDDSGNPTPILERLAKTPDDEFQGVLAEHIQSVYAEVFAFTDPATASLKDIENAFRSYTPRGQRRRMVTLFVGLCEAAGIIKEAPKAARTRKKSPSRSTTPKKAGATSSSTSTHKKPPKTDAVQSPGNLPPAIAGLIASLPPDGKGWTKEERDKFLATFPVVLDFCYAIVKTEPVNGENVGSPDLFSST